MSQERLNIVDFRQTNIRTLHLTWFAFFLTFVVTLSLLIAGCIYNSQTKTNTEEQQNIDNASVKTIDNSVCPVVASRNWHAWIDRVAGNATK